jgi:ATP-binding cassette subfamily C protein EexD
MFYMINVFDKAVGTGSFSTLMSLILIAVFLYTILALLEWTRARVLVFVASRLDYVLAPRVYHLCFESESGGISGQSIGSRPLSDLNSLRQFISGSAVLALFDLPWLPVYLVVMLLFHPTLAVVGVVCMVILLVLAIANQKTTTEGLKKANSAASKISLQTQRNLRNAEVASAMGMFSALAHRWRDEQDKMLAVQEKTSNKASGYTASIKTMTTAMQSAAITTGAVLVMQQQISPGVMIGAAMLLGRSLAPIQQTVTSWKGFIEAREQYSRLNSLLDEYPPADDKMSLPLIHGNLLAKNAVVVAPGGETPILANINFAIPAGATVMVLGQSAAGKSTLVRTILGLWPTLQGEVRIDGAEASSYDREDIGPQIGYLPQDIELFDGTVAENIARFTEVDPQLVVQAANDAGIHEMILSLPKGYDTVISGQRGSVSPGQRQRIALARALYKRPKLVVLDEPNSNLDEVGEQALNSAIETLKAAGSTVVLVSHRQGAVPLSDYIIIMEAGRITEQGSRADVVARAQARREQKAVAPTVEQQDKVPVKAGGPQGDQ